MSKITYDPYRDDADVKDKLGQVLQVIEDHIFGQSHVMKLCLAATIADAHVVLSGDTGNGLNSMSIAFERALNLYEQPVLDVQKKGDRFLVCVPVKDIAPEDAERILDLKINDRLPDVNDIKPVLTANDGDGSHELIQIQKLTNRISVSSAVCKHIADVVLERLEELPSEEYPVHHFSEGSVEPIPYVSACTSSTSEAFNIGSNNVIVLTAVIRMAKAMALINGRDSVDIQDVNDVIEPLFPH